MKAAASSVVGLPPERLTLPQRRTLAGQWIALELYNPQNLPLRVIAAQGRSAQECIRQLRAEGRDPGRYEYLVLDPPY